MNRSKNISRKEEYYWNRLDNTAKVYPAISGNNSTNVFRLSVKLKEKVVPSFLENALQTALKLLPTFNVKLRRGLFWYYFDTNFARPTVREDSTFPCNSIDRFKENGFLFRVTYFEKKINLEVFHALSDGTGAFVFLNCLVTEYLKLCYPNDEKLRLAQSVDSSLPQSAYEENSFMAAALKNPGAKSSSGTNVPSDPPAYRIPGVFVGSKELRVIHALVYPKELLALAKEKGVTLTVYLTALLLLSIYEESWKYSNRKYPVSVCIPINLRTWFKSDTLRNFFSFIHVTVDFRKKEYTFDELLSEVSKQLKEKITKDAMLEKIVSNTNAEKSFALRIIPLFLKKLGLKIISMKTERANTCTLSNLGVLKFTDAANEYVERCDVLMNSTSHQTLKLGVSSVNDCLSLTFTSSTEESDIQRFFCRFLTERSVKIRIITN